MDICEQHLYLSLHHTEDDSFKINTFKDMSSLVLDWKPTTRVSPIWQLKSHRCKQSDILNFSNIAILGPLDPTNFIDETSTFLNEEISLWISLGIMNLIVGYNTSETTNHLAEWAKAKKVTFELWEIGSDNTILKKSFFRNYEKKPEKEWRQRLSNLFERKTSPSIELALSEFAPLLASTLSRLEDYNFDMSESLIELIEYVEEAIVSFEFSKDQNDAIAAATITTINAGLSRFSSQSLSGVIPITATESHFWVHSLFGIGIAGIGLSNLVRFISDKVGKAYIPNKVEQLSCKNDAVPQLSHFHSNDNFWKTNYIDGIELKNPPPLSTDITFFSGRDGFKAHLTNLSVPLTTVFSCNSEKWTLLTITHEICHKILKAVLSLIYPIDGTVDEGLITKEDASHLFHSEEEPKDWLAAIRMWLWETINIIDGEDNCISSNKIDDSDYNVKISLMESMDRWYGEVEEIIVHVFDFCYFYRSEDSRYLKEIWMTWSVIPNISSRVPEYVLRSICAILSKNLHRDSTIAVSVSIDRVKERLEDLYKSDPDMPYVSDAIDYIKEASESRVLQTQLQARLPLVRFVRTFLYSEKTIDELWRETSTQGGRTGKDRYNKKVLTLDSINIDNPLLFLETYSTDKQSSESRSAWIYYNLAFHVRS